MKKIIFLFIISIFTCVHVYADNVYGPDITLKTTVKSVEVGKQVKINVNLSEPVLKFNRSSISADGASIESVRKLSPYSYLVFARAEENSKVMSVQIESGRVQNYSKVFNEYASNEVNIKIIQLKPAATVSNENEISKLLDSVVKANQVQNSTPVQVAQPQSVQQYQQVQYTQPVQYAQPQVSYNPNVYYPQYGANYYNNYPYSQVQPITPIYQPTSYYPTTYYPTSFYDDYDDWFDW